MLRHSYCTYTFNNNLYLDIQPTDNQVLDALHHLASLQSYKAPGYYIEHVLQPSPIQYMKITLEQYLVSHNYTTNNAKILRSLIYQIPWYHY